ncbi:hypothetical protein MKW92_047858 [Papaver armeniacum]|nr:hypothetical protein MKW92_047858 [Papaver armeniacum]
MEIIQNAEDNEYSDGVKPSLEFVMTTTDITATGAPATLLVCNNEKGFLSKNIDSICGVGVLLKKDIGSVVTLERKVIFVSSIGFKSVFLITAHPYIFSNGYQIKFSEDPCPQCNVGYIVPQWVEEHPTVAEIQQIYGSERSLPTTIIVLPLKSDKVHPVKQQCSNIHPEVLLFLSKNQKGFQLEANQDPKLNTLCEENVSAESYTLHLSAGKNSASSEGECSYYNNRRQKDFLGLSLALPIGQRLNRGMGSPLHLCILPTDMVTSFPFIIQADFVWHHRGKLFCWTTNGTRVILDSAPVSTLANMFAFLPVNLSSYPQLNTVRDSIKMKLMEENILPSESNSAQKFFYKPAEVGRILPAFWDILLKAEKQGMTYIIYPILSVSSLGYALPEYKHQKIPLLKYIGEDRIVSLLSIADASKQGMTICLSNDSRYILAY